MKQIWLFLGLLLTAQALATDDHSTRMMITNDSNEPLEVWLMGDACVTFDDGAYQHVPCQAALLRNHSSILFWDLEQNPLGNTENSVVVPLFRFADSYMGFRYHCHVHEGDFMISLKAHALHVSLVHWLIVTDQYRYWPNPQLACKLTSCQEDCEDLLDAQLEFET